MDQQTNIKASDNDVLERTFGLTHETQSQHDQDSAERASRMPTEIRQMRAARVRGVLHERRRRAEYFRAETFSDPAWDVLLELYASELSQQRITALQLGAASGVPPSTVLRWIKLLELDGLLVRKFDPLDAACIFVELTFKGARAMSGYFRGGSG